MQIYWVNIILKDNFVLIFILKFPMTSEKQKILVAAFLLVSFLGYSFYLYSSLPVKTYAINEEASKGKIVWQKYNCNACHQVYGLGGYLGPDLTNVYSARGPEYIKAFLTTGTASMPNFHLKEAEINSLLAFMNNIDKSGRSDPRTFTIKYNGSIEQ